MHLKRDQCPLCSRPVTPAALGETRWNSPQTIGELARQHPGWRVDDGACPACLQQALLTTLLRDGHAALHSAFQEVWPLDARAAFRAVPTPLRLHADPRFTGRGVTLALVDSGFYPHPDLLQPTNRIRTWADASRDPVTVLEFDEQAHPTWPEWDTAHGRLWHGLMTSTVAAGNGHRSHGLYRGLASDANLVLVQVRDNAGRITDTNVARALGWLADHGPARAVRIVSVSLASDNTGPDKNRIDAAVRALVERGIVVVAASGNDGVRSLVPPATAPEALTVGGIDDHNEFDEAAVELWHSNYGATADGAAKPELVAPSIWVTAPVLPGTDVDREALSLFGRRLGDPHPEGVERRLAELKLVTPHYQHVDGTSVAAPIAASVVACMLEANPDLTPDLVRQILMATARPVPGVSTARQGAGTIVAGAAVAAALQHRHPELAAALRFHRVEGRVVAFVLHDHDANAAEVFGSWDGWAGPTPLRQSPPGVWRTEVTTPGGGRYSYKFRLDGHRWLDDPANPRKRWDGLGGFNSLVLVD